MMADMTKGNILIGGSEFRYQSPAMIETVNRPDASISRSTKIETMTTGGGDVPSFMRDYTHKTVGVFRIVVRRRRLVAVVDSRWPLLHET